MDLVDLRRYNQRTAQNVEELAQAAIQLQAVDGAQRLLFVAEYFKKLSIEEAHRMLSPGELLHEVEASQSHKKVIKTLTYLRAFFGLAPLIWTWSSLSIASNGYNAYVNQHAATQTQTFVFLKLWQDGSLNPGWLTFSTTAIIDVALLLIFLLLNLLTLRLENLAHSQAQEFATRLYDITAQLMQVVADEGVSQLTSDAQVDRVVKAIQRVMANAFHASQKATETAKDGIDTLFQQLRPIVEQFDQNTKEFHLDLDRLSNDLGSLKTDLDKVKDLAAASKDLAANTAQHTTISANIEKHISNLSQIEREMITKISDTQKNMATTVDQNQHKLTDKIDGIQKIVMAEIANVASEMNKATSQMTGAVKDIHGSIQHMQNAIGAIEQTGKQITQIKESDVTKISDQVKLVTINAGSVSDALIHVEKQLKDTTKKLFEAANALYIVTDTPRRTNTPSPGHHPSSPVTGLPLRPPQEGTPSTGNNHPSKQPLTTKQLRATSDSSKPLPPSSVKPARQQEVPPWEADKKKE